MDPDRLENLRGGGDPYRDDDDRGDSLTQIRRQKGDGTYAGRNPNEEQWAPSIHQQHIAQQQADTTTQGE